MTAEHYWTASDGTRLFYRADDFTDPWTDASTVVLLHPGMGSSLRLFGWVPHLARHFRVVRPDTRGHGRSEPGPLDGLGHDRLSLDLFELFDHLGIASAHVMGSSAGGMIAGQAAGTAAAMAGQVDGDVHRVDVTALQKLLREDGQILGLPTAPSGPSVGAPAEVLEKVNEATRL